MARNEFTPYDIRIRICQAILSEIQHFSYKTSLRGLGVLNGNDRISGEAWFLRKILKLPDHAVVFDVGANIGLYSTSILKYFPSAVVFAFEPHPLNYSKLLAIQNINPVRAAIGASHGKTVIFDYEKMDGTAHASLFRGVIENIHGSKSISHRVPCVTLDRFAKEKKIKEVKFLKIDTEGNELNVLLGAAQLLKEKRIETIQFEFNEMNTVSRVFFRDFQELLPDHAFYRLLPAGLLPLEKNSPMTNEIFGYQNIIATLAKW